MFEKKDADKINIDNTDTKDFVEIKEDIKKRKEKSGVLSKKERLAVIHDQQQVDINELYESKNWEGIASLYFDVRGAMTGWDGFKLEDDKKTILAVSLSKFMKALLAIDPKYVAGVVFLTSFGSIIAEKEMLYTIEKNKALRIKKNESQTGIFERNNS